MSNEDQEEEVKMPTEEEITKLFEKRTQDILFAFTDEMLALEAEIKKVKEK